MNVACRSTLYPELEFLGGAVAHADEIYEFIGKGPLFEEFSRAEVDALCQHADCFAAPRGARLLTEGEHGAHMFIILTGKVVVTRQDGSDRPIRIATLGPGSVVGEMALIDGERRYATCTAIEPADIAVLTRRDLDEILQMSPRLANKLLIRLLQLVVVRLRRTGDEVVSLTLVGA